MFGIVTTSTLEKYHRIFDELGYQEDELATQDSFMDAAIKTLNHAKDLDNAEDVVCLIRDCLDHWGTIETIFKKKLDVWKQYEWEGPQDIELEENNDGVSYITNAFSIKGKDYWYTSSELGDEYLLVEGDKNVWVAQLEPNPTHYIVCDNNFPFDVDFYKYTSDRLVATLSFDDVFYLDNNKMKIDINAPEGEEFIQVYPSDYFKTVKEGEQLDTDKMLFGFEFDRVDEKGKYCIARIETYSECEIELEAYLAIACIVKCNKVLKYYKDKMNAESASLAFSRIATIGALNSIRPH